jgi:hypothetical protein
MRREPRLTNAVSSWGLEISVGLVTPIALGTVAVGVASADGPSGLLSFEGVLDGVTLSAVVGAISKEGIIRS